MPASIIICKECGEERPLHGRGMCQKCYKTWWVRTNPDKVHEHNMKPASIERRKKKYKEWAKDNRDKRRASNRDHRERNKDYYNELNRKWRIENREQHIRNAKRWQKNNPEKARLNSTFSKHRRRARAAKLPNTLTKKQWKAILDGFDHACAYCGRKLKRLQQEHVVPISKGGGYTKDNIIPACKRCNGTKSDMDLKDFLEYIDIIGIGGNVNPLVYEYLNKKSEA